MDLPGHGQTPEEADSGTFDGLARSLDSWLRAEDFVGVDMVGSSLGARLVLEMARRGQAGAVVALDPGGFWQGSERTFFKATITPSVALVRALRPALSAIMGMSLAGPRSWPSSARRWALDPAFVARELKSLAGTPTVNSLVEDLANGAMQEGPTNGCARCHRLGTQGSACLPQQADRAMKAFPEATLHWFERSGHFPMSDQPQETVRVIVDATSISESK